MNDKRITHLVFVLTGAGFLAVSLLTGCSWNVEGGNFRASSPSDEEEEQTR